MKIPFILPPLILGQECPVWEGKSFCVGSSIFPILEYNSMQSGWSDELTSFHEDVAGDRHFIDQASHRYVLKQIQKFLRSTPSVILEIGCSSGFLLKKIRKTFPREIVIGADVVKKPLYNLHAQMQDIPLLRFNLLDCPLYDNSVDVIIMLNVLEHIEDDFAALRQVNRILKPGGIVIIEVPAGDSLYDFYDKSLQHFRRYSSRFLKILVEKQGFQIMNRSHLGFFIYPGFWLVKKINQHLDSLSAEQATLKLKAQINTGKHNFFLKMLMNFELFLGSYISYPFGIRCLMVCMKIK